MNTDYAKNAMLGADPSAYLSLHTAWSATGASEVTGGSPAYARKAASWGSASGGSRALSSAVTLDMPGNAVTPVVALYVGRWDAITSGNFLGMSPLGGSEKKFSVDLTAETVIEPGHGRVNGSQVVFIGGTAPGGLTAGTSYFVVSTATDTYQVAATSGGSAINLTAHPTAGCVVSTIVPQSFTSQGTLQITSLPLTIAG